MTRTGSCLLLAIASVLSFCFKHHDNAPRLLSHGRRRSEEAAAMWDIPSKARAMEDLSWWELVFPTIGAAAGHHGSTNYGDLWIVKLTKTGLFQWEKSLGGSGGDVGYSIQQTSDGGYIVAGNSGSNDGDVTGHHGSTDSMDCWIVKLTNAGDIQWQKSLGGSGVDQASSIQQTSDGGYIIAGRSSSTDGDVTGNHGSYDCWIVKLTTVGEIQWQDSLVEVVRTMDNPSNKRAMEDTSSRVVAVPLMVM